MRTLIIVASATLALCGCTTPEGVQRQALSNCQSVGISEKDPQFATCMRAFRLQSQEDRLEQSYHDALTWVGERPRNRHQQTYVY